MDDSLYGCRLNMLGNENLFQAKNIWQALTHRFCILMASSHAICLHKHHVYMDSLSN